MRNALLVAAAMAIGLASCNGSRLQPEAPATDTTCVLPTPDVDLVLYSHEDISNATEKIKRAFKLSGRPIKVDDWHNSYTHDYIIGYHYYYGARTKDYDVEYHIVSAYDDSYKHHPDWFGYLTVSFSSDKPDAFDVLNELAEMLDNAYRQDTAYHWDAERQQWTNGKQYVYIQEPTRDERDGKVYSVCCMMPIDRVRK